MDCSACGLRGLGDIPRLAPGSLKLTHYRAGAASYNRPEMTAPTWRPDWRTALPRVSPVRWWLYRIATGVAVLFVGGAAIYPYPKCLRLTSIQPRITAFHLPPCDASWHIPLRIEVALTGILIGLIIAFIGARLDHLILRSRRHRGVALLPSP